MPTPQELEAKFWKALNSDMTVMLGLDGVEDGHTRPMTAQTEEEGAGPIWFFASTENKLVEELGGETGGMKRAIATFTSKGHDLFASIHGSIRVDTDRAMVDKLWNGFVAAWYEHGKDDPKLALLRLDAERAEIWENASSVFAGLKLLLGADPKKDVQSKVAEVTFS